MSKRLALLLLCLAAVRLSADDKLSYIDTLRDATPQERALTSVDFAPGAAAVVLDWVQVVNDTDAYRTEYVRIKVLKEEGKKYGDVEVPYVPSLSRVNHIKARTIRPDGTIALWDGKSFDKTVVKMAGVRVAAKTFTLPDVQVGSILEYRYDISNDSHLLYDTEFLVQRELPVLHEYLSFRPYSGGQYAALFSVRGLPPGKKPEKVGTNYDLELEKVAAFEEEPFGPPADALKPQVQFWYASDTPKIDEFWTKQAREWADVVEPFAGDGRGVRDVATATIAGATTPDEKLRKLYARVQQVRNLSYEPEKTEQETKKLHDNKSAQDVLRNGYGWRNEINRTFVSLARAAGFEANVVRLGERDERFLAKELPIGRQLDGEETVVTVDGKPLYLDPGTPYAPFGIVAWQKTAAPGILLKKKIDQAAWQMTPPPAVDDAVTRRVADLQLDASGAVRGKVVLTYSGQEALYQRLAARNDDDAAVKKSLEESLKQVFGSGATVKVTEVKDLRTTEVPLVVTADVELPTAASVVGSRALMPLSVFAVNRKNPFTSADRKYPLYFHYPYRVDDDITLHLPDGYSVESLPTATNVDMKALRYTTAYEAKGTALHLARNVAVDAVLIKREQYPAVRSFFSQMSDADQQQVVLRKAAK